MKEVGVFGLAATALAICGYLAIMGNEQALIAVVGILSASGGFYFRGKVEESR
jgi:hypothetical protein